MANDTEKQIINGIVDEALPNTLFRVTLESGEHILTFLAGRMKRYHIRVVVGDKVSVQLDPYGGKGRIIKRL